MNSSLLNEKNQSRQKLRRKLKTSYNRSGYTAYPDSWDTIKLALRVKFIAPSADRKRERERAHASDLRAYLKALEQNKETILKRSSDKK